MSLFDSFNNQVTSPAPVDLNVICSKSCGKVTQCYQRSTGAHFCVICCKSESDNCSCAPHEVPSVPCGSECNGCVDCGWKKKWGCDAPCKYFTCGC